MSDGEAAIGDIAAQLAAARSPGACHIVGVTGSVASGKSTFAGALHARLRDGHGARTEVVCTDGFLHPNAVLDARGLTARKGFPESYDTEALRLALAAIRRGPARFPGYSHVIYDVDAALDRTLDPPDLLIVEGLGLHEDLTAPGATARAIDTLIYLDAKEERLEDWFVARFMGLWTAAETDPASFYARFRAMSEAEARAFAGTVWRAINLPNLRQHIVHARALADIVIHKTDSHRIRAVERRGKSGSNISVVPLS